MDNYINLPPIEHAETYLQEASHSLFNARNSLAKARYSEPLMKAIARDGRSHPDLESADSDLEQAQLKICDIIGQVRARLLIAREQGHWPAP